MRTAGFTLLEVLVAMTIVGLVSIGALGAVAAAEAASERATRLVVASELAEERLASLITLPASILADSADGRSHGVGGLAGWRWSATLVPRGSSLVTIAVTIHGPGANLERRALRPVEDAR